MPPDGVPERGIRSRKRPIPLDISFDFVVAERPIYVPNSGPPLAPLSIMPAHDKDGIIIGKVSLYGKELYVVAYENQPQLRVAVRPENIRDWVSARTLENWEWDQQVKFESEEGLSLPTAKQQKKNKKSRGKSRRPGKRKRAKIDTPIARRPSVSRFDGYSSGPARKRQQVEAEMPIWTSPNALKQMRGPSLASPSKGVGLLNTVIDTDFSTDEDDTNNAIAAQLNATTRNSSIPSRGNTSTPDPLTTPQTSRLVPFKAAQSVSTRESSISQPEPRGLAQPISSRASSPSQPDSTQNTDNSTSAELRASRKDSVAKSSSRLAFQLYEELEKKGKGKKAANANSKPLTISQKYSHFRRAPTMFSQSPEEKNVLKAARGSSPQSDLTLEDRGEVLSSEEEDDEDEEWEVDYIKADKMRKASDGKRKLHYLIKWVGNWDDSWEPAENVNFAAIQSYKEKQPAEKKSSRHRISSVSEKAKASRNGIGKGKTSRQGKGKAPRKLQRATPMSDIREDSNPATSSGDESDDDSLVREKGENPLPSPTEDSDHDTLFVSSRKRKPSSDVAASIPWKRVKKVARRRN